VHPKSAGCVALLILGGLVSNAEAQCDSAVPHCLPLQLWVGPGVDEGWLKAQIGEANARLQSVGVAVEIVEVKTRPPALARITTTAQRNALLDLGKQTPLRLFVVDHLADADDPKEHIRGVTWRRRDEFAVILWTGANRWVLAHELGHVFGLPHSREHTSIMNKTVRVISPTQLVYTAREQPIMKRTIARLLATRRLQQKN
jgi:hypothetical protein